MQQKHVASSKVIINIIELLLKKELNEKTGILQISKRGKRQRENVFKSRVGYQMSHNFFLKRISGA